MNGAAVNPDAFSICQSNGNLKPECVWIYWFAWGFRLICGFITSRAVKFTFCNSVEAQILSVGTAVGLLFCGKCRWTCVFDCRTEHTTSALISDLSRFEFDLGSSPLHKTPCVYEMPSCVFTFLCVCVCVCGLNPRLHACLCKNTDLMFSDVMFCTSLPAILSNQMKYRSTNTFMIFCSNQIFWCLISDIDVWVKHHIVHYHNIVSMNIWPLLSLFKATHNTLDLKSPWNQIWYSWIFIHWSQTFVK